MTMKLLNEGDTKEVCNIIHIDGLVQDCSDSSQLSYQYIFMLWFW